MTGPSRLLAGLVLVVGCHILNPGRVAGQVTADTVASSSPPCASGDRLPVSPTPFPRGQSIAPDVVAQMPNLCGRPSGSSGVVRIRGTRLPAAAEPPYYVDGVRATAEEFRLLRPEQIQSIQIIRGSEALSRLGIEDPSAAVVVTTRPAVAPEDEVPQ